MNFPDTVTLKRAAGEDEYGNPGESWDAPTVVGVFRAFVPSRATAYFPPKTPPSEGDRFTYGGDLFQVDEVVTIRTPTKVVMHKATLKHLGRASG